MEMLRTFQELANPSQEETLRDSSSYNFKLITQLAFMWQIIDKLAVKSTPKFQRVFAYRENLQLVAIGSGAVAEHITSMDCARYQSSVSSLAKFRHISKQYRV